MFENLLDSANFYFYFSAELTPIPIKSLRICNTVKDSPHRIVHGTHRESGGSFGSGMAGRSYRTGDQLGIDVLDVQPQQRLVTAAGGGTACTGAGAPLVVRGQCHKISYLRSIHYT